MNALTQIRRSGSVLVVVCLMALSGCGTTFDEVLFQSVGAAGRTFLDILLTDAANSLADSLDQGGTTVPGDTGGGGGTAPPPAGPPLADLTGDPNAGAGIFTSNNCTACHCADASGGCALSAPSLVGVAVEMLDGRLRGDTPHPGGKFTLTNQEIVDLQAYLASLAAGGG